MSFHSTAWMCWATAGVVAVIAAADPAASLLAIGMCAVVWATCAGRGPEGGSYVLLVKIGLVFVGARVLLFGLTGRTGPTTVATLPRAQLPVWLGGFQIGGRITGEVVAQALAEGLQVLAVLSIAGVALSVVPMSRVLRGVPRSLHEAGIVVGIALTFVPLVVRSAADIRDAQRLRGHRFRGVRATLPLIVPVLADAMERSLALAAAMETRAFGRSSSRDARARRLVAASALLTVTGICALVFGLLVAVPLIVAAVGCGVCARARRPRHGPTRYRVERMDGWDRACIAAMGCAILLAVAARASGNAAWYPYPVLSVPALHPLTLLPAALLLSPAVLTLARDIRPGRAAEVAS